jgi:tRNA1(Val) A37 N6-methylase TrmN6
MEAATTENTLLGGRVRLLQPARGYRIAIDAVLLAAAAEAAPGHRVLDLGAGVAAVGLCVTARLPGCTVTGIELQAPLVELARRNARLNGREDRVRTLQHDLAAALPAGLGAFDMVLTNPPFLPASRADPSPDPVKALATVESSAGLARWIAVATAAARHDGAVVMIHRADRLDEIASLFAAAGWGDLAVRPLVPPRRVLVRARRGTGPRRTDSPALALHRPDGGFTDEAEAILRHAAPLAF